MDKLGGKLDMKTINIIIIFGIVSLFLGLTILPSSNAEFTNLDASDFKMKEHSIQNVVILRFGPDGDLKTTKINIEIGDKSDVSEAINEKCNELYENDKQLQQFINERSIYQKIESHGYGYHFSIFLPMRQSKLIFRSAIIYRYFHDEDYTNINNQTLLLGPQKARILGFIGYICFSGRSFGYITINGYATFRIDIKPTI